LRAAKETILMELRRFFLVMPLVLISLAARAQVTRVTDESAFFKQLHTNRFQARGGIAASTVADAKQLSFPHFSSSFTVQGATFPYTMVGFPPPSGKTAVLKSVIVPLRLRFVGFGSADFVFQPDIAVSQMLASPIFNDARFPNGTGQFGDMLQRATFFNKMDARHAWHVKMAAPRVLPTQEISVGKGTGNAVFQVTADPASLLGQINIDKLDHSMTALVQSLGIAADEVPIFITYNAFADFALGFHDAFHVAHADGSEGLQTLIYSSWLDINLVGSLLADVSTLNHEVGEWLNDPYVNNIVPDWMYPPIGDPLSECSFNPFLEVGDPQGNGPTFREFPTVPITLNGFQYHFQDLVMLPWFADEVPSSAFKGWYDFPATTQITAPAQYCQ
jgi:hypothetical protein